MCVARARGRVAYVARAHVPVAHVRAVRLVCAVEDLADAALGRVRHPGREGESAVKMCCTTNIK